MKYKSRPVYPDIVLKSHALVFTVFVMGIWHNILLRLNSPDYIESNFHNMKNAVWDRVGWTLAWGAIFLVHLVASIVANLMIEMQKRQPYSEHN